MKQLNPFRYRAYVPNALSKNLWPWIWKFWFNQASLGKDSILAEFRPRISDSCYTNQLVSSPVAVTKAVNTAMIQIANPNFDDFHGSIEVVLGMRLPNLFSMPILVRRKESTGQGSV